MCCPYRYQFTLTLLKFGLYIAQLTVLPRKTILKVGIKQHFFDLSSPFSSLFNSFSNYIKQLSPRFFTTTKIIQVLNISGGSEWGHMGGKGASLIKSSSVLSPPNQTTMYSTVLLFSHWQLILSSFFSVHIQERIKRPQEKEIFAAHVFEDYNHNRHQATYHQGQDTLDSSHSSLQGKMSNDTWWWKALPSSRANLHSRGKVAQAICISKQEKN